MEHRTLSTKGLGLAAAAVCALAAAVARAQPPAPLAGIPGTGLAFALPPLADFTERPEGQGGLDRTWSGRLGSSWIVITLRLIPEADALGVDEPELVVELLRTSLRAPRGYTCSRFPHEAEVERLRERHDARGIRVAIGPVATWRGAFGASPFAGFARGTVRARAGGPVTGSHFALGGLLPGSAYLLDATCEPADPDAEAGVMEFLRHGVRYDGPLRDPRWTEAEVRKRWRQAWPDDRPLPPLRVARTPHHIVFSTASTGNAVLRRIERTWQRIRKQFPFPEDPARRLLPVWLFRSKAEYDIVAPPDTIGVSRGSWIAATYAAPTDSVIGHELVHQAFRNRLFLAGGGAWLQEGLAHVLTAPRESLAAEAREVAAGSGPALKEFAGAWRLGDDARPRARRLPWESSDRRAPASYDRAALLVEFLREVRLGPDRFRVFLSRAGLVRDVDEVEEALQVTAGVDFAALEPEWRRWCVARAAGGSGRP